MSVCCQLLKQTHKILHKLYKCVLSSYLEKNIIIQLPIEFIFQLIVNLNNITLYVGSQVSPL